MRRQERLLPFLLCHEVLSETDDFLRLQIQCEVPGVQDVYFGSGVILLVRFSTGYRERSIEARFMEVTIQALSDLEDDLHHDRRADRQALNTVHHPRMTVFGAEQLNEQIRCTVSDGGVLDKLLRRGQSDAQLHQLL